MAARVMMETDKCWEYFMALAKDTGTLEWAKAVLCGKWKEFEEKFN
jgi:hypothetical protein